MRLRGVFGMEPFHGPVLQPSNYFDTPPPPPRLPKVVHSSAPMMTNEEYDNYDWDGMMEEEE